jgi:hypothetical protein
MKSKILFLAQVIFLLPAIALSQNPDSIAKMPNYKNQTNLQFNQYAFQKGTFDALGKNIRYEYVFPVPFTTGPEISSSLHSYNYYLEIYYFRKNIFTGNNDLNEKGNQAFFEVAPVYAHRYFPDANSSSEIKENKFGIYAAPGITLSSKKQKYSFDLLYKFNFPSAFSLF